MQKHLTEKGTAAIIMPQISEKQRIYARGNRIDIKNCYL